MRISQTQANMVKNSPCFFKIVLGRVSQYFSTLYHPPSAFTPASPARSCHPPGPSETRSPWTAQGSPGPCPPPSPSASAPPGQRPACLVSPPSSWSRTGSPAPPAAQRRSSLYLEWGERGWRKVGRHLFIIISDSHITCFVFLCVFNLYLLLPFCVVDLAAVGSVCPPVRALEH